MESDGEPTTFDKAAPFKEAKSGSSPNMSPLQTVENNEAPTVDGDDNNIHDVEKSITVVKLDDGPKASFEFGLLEADMVRTSYSLSSPATTEESPMDVEATTATREPHSSVIVPLSSVMTARSDRSASVQSVGSCEREASPTPSRRRSTRRRTERSYAQKGEDEHEEDHHDGLSGRVSSEKSAHPSEASHSSKKLSQGLKHLNIVRQSNPNLNTCWDAFCWRCHKNVPLAEQHGCPSCERCFHDSCWWNESPYAGSKDHGAEAPSTSPLMDNENVVAEGDESRDEMGKPSECVECFSMLDESKKGDSPYNLLGPGKFKEILLYMMRFVDEHLQPDRVRPFAIPVLEQDECTPVVKAKYAEVITHPMDLRQITKNIKEGKYSTTASFVADLRWILHNTTIFNGQNNRYTRSAVYIVDTCQNLCCSLEWCPECFLRQMPTASDNGVSEALERGMITPCSNPHAVVWVKAEKFPLWPAIVYRFNGGTADVRFFGAFEFGTFPKEAIYLFSKNPVTDRRKGKLKIEYENALRQFRLHIAKLRVMSTKQVVSYPKKTPYDGRLWMFPEDEDGLPSHSELPHSGEDENEAVSVTGDDAAIETDNHPPNTDVYDYTEEKASDSAPPPPPVARNSRLESLIQKAAERTKRAASAESASSDKSATTRKKRRRGLDSDEVPVVSHEASHEAIADLIPEDNLEEAEVADVELISSEPIPQVPLPISQDILVDGSHRLDVPLVEGTKDETDLPAEEVETKIADVPREEVLFVPAEKADLNKDLPSVSSDINASGEGEAEEKEVVEKSEARELPKDKEQTVKPVFDVSDSEMELPSFEMPEDSFDVKRRASTGKLDLMLKKTASPEKKEGEGSSASPKDSEASSETTPKVNEKRPVAEPSTAKSVLHEALVRPFNAHRDLIQGVGLRRAKPSPSLSMAGTQSHLIVALGASAKTATSSDSPTPTDQAGRMASSPSAESSSSSSPREEVLGRLLATAGEAQRKAPSVVPAVRTQPVTVTQPRPILPKVDNSPTEATRVPDGRRINALSDQLNLSAARNAQARSLRIPESSSTPSNLQRSLLARSLNAPPGTRLTLPNSFANGSSPSTSRVAINGNSEEAARSSSPLTAQLSHNLSTMRNLLAQRSTGSPGLQTAHEASRNSPVAAIAHSNAAGQSAATTAKNRTSPTGGLQSVMQSESIQSQIELFLRNTKKLVKDKRVEGAETTREISRANAECIRFMQDAHLKSLQASDRTIQDLQETLEQSVRKFELLFMVLQNETEFSQKAKVLEVSRMKDLERQRAIATAKRTLWCCVCQKRAKLICCGVTLYCSETCQMNNSPLHLIHCHRNPEAHGDGDVNVYTPYGQLRRCAAPAAGPEEEEDALEGDGGNAQPTGSSIQTNGWDPRSSRVSIQEEDTAND
ncbi:hypothetical protein RvY_13825 [Ramazzottius varieornatus]|uniref:Protein kinase C-binding protein 1 n=1 Tax=Ramazzottius varieornatus TaxID=947166 RepID=A0A1D1VRD1_RAMVA|nr:hypothetical protein RvY_13825 [Ramazzottius varieornatus]